MTHQVSVWRAAQLVGVARGVLQQQVRSGVLTLNDGMVSTGWCLPPVTWVLRRSKA